MSVAAGDLSLAADAPRCPQCAQAMEPCDLEGHYGNIVPTDVCPRCNLVWFDEFESVRLSGLGWVALLRRMQAAMAGGSGPMGSALECPRCRAALKPVSNLTRFGRFAALECPKRHGHLQTFSLLLAERGMVRPMGRTDFEALADEKREPCCLNCGGPLSGRAQTCSYCDSPLVVIDMPRLMEALLMRHAEALPEEAAGHVAWPCRGCGAPLAPNETARCARCHHQVVVPSVLDLRPVLDKVEPLLRAALPRAARPHGEKLKNMRGDYRATAFDRFLRHAADMTSDDEPGDATARFLHRLNRWGAWAVLAFAIWYFWF
jgi:hypothetical protein